VAPLVVTRPRGEGFPRLVPLGRVVLEGPDQPRRALPVEESAVEKLPRGIDPVHHRLLVEHAGGDHPEGLEQFLAALAGAELVRVGVVREEVNLVNVVLLGEHLGVVSEGLAVSLTLLPHPLARAPTAGW
jgi:hypothetical protein